MEKRSFVFGDYFPIFHTVKLENDTVLYLASRNKAWKYKVSDDSPLKIKNILEDLFKFLNDEVIKYKIKVGDFEISEFDKYNFYTSIQSILNLVAERPILRIDSAFFYYDDLHELIKNILVDPVKRDSYIDAIANWDTKYKLDDVSPIENELNLNSCGNPYRLNDNYDEQNHFGKFFKLFAIESKKILYKRSGDFLNLEKYFSGDCDFAPLVFNIKVACLRKYFEKIHETVLGNNSLIKADDGRLPNIFICSSCYTIDIKKTVAAKTPINFNTFSGANASKCGNINSIQNISNCIKPLKDAERHKPILY